MTTADIPTVQEALDRFRQTYPEVGSVQHIALLDEEGFVAQYATSAFDNDTRLARRVYQHASDIASRTALIWANIKDAASPYLRQTLFNTVPDDFLQQIPAYDRLFGSLDYTECDHARSIFGPAAYFVDLLRFVETHVGDSPPPDGLKLLNRRPDLECVRLDKANTFDLIPYIEVVNEVLKAIVRTKRTPDAFELIEAAGYPMTLPFNLPLAEIRSYLNQLQTSLHEIYRVIVRTSLPLRHGSTPSTTVSIRYCPKGTLLQKMRPRSTLSLV